MKNLLFGLGCMLALLTISCNKKDEPSVPAKKNAAVTVRLTDGPAAYEAVNIDVRQVEIQHETQGTIILTPVQAGVYNLLDFRNGVDMLLCQADIPPGKISQIRLILGNNNSVKIKGVSYPLETPSAEQSGLKLNLQHELEANMAYTLWIDMDAAKSIVKTGSGKYQLKPTGHAYTAHTDGRIKGSVIPLQPGTMVYAINGTDTYSAIPSSAGFFMFCGLPEGKYKIRVEADFATAIEEKDVLVRFGAVTDLGILSLLP
ncbi:MAG TPA: DUF4382 domain-containing protein [Chitinophagaceae bacterium]|nr:DUF4382 domain-containing protein [Chitinophagaceae bacterium]